MNKEFFLAEWNREFPLMVGLFKALPEDTLDYTPHPMTRTSRQIVSHLIAHLDDFTQMMQNGVIHFTPETAFTDMTDAIAQYEAKNAILVEAIEKASNEDWASKEIDLFFFGHKAFSLPMNIMAWRTYHLDNIHHRGQLSTYVRPMGGKNPMIYGPTADTLAEAA